MNNMQEASTHIEHDCYQWNHRVYQLRPKYTATSCGVCDRIIGFKWRRWQDRVRSLFTDNPPANNVQKKKKCECHFCEWRRNVVIGFLATLAVYFACIGWDWLMK